LLAVPNFNLPSIIFVTASAVCEAVSWPHLTIPSMFNDPGDKKDEFASLQRACPEWKEGMFLALTYI